MKHCYLHFKQFQFVDIPCYLVRFDKQFFGFCQNIFRPKPPLEKLAYIPYVSPAIIHLSFAILDTGRHYDTALRTFSEKQHD